MVEKYFTRPKTVARLHAGPLGPHLSTIAQALHEARYSTATIRLHLRAADRFGAWLRTQKIALADLSNAIVDRYIQGLDRQWPASVPNGKLPNSALGLRHLVEVLRQAERLHPATAAEPQSSVEAWLADFDHHLDHVIGCALGSRNNYLRYARRLLLDVFGEAEVDWSRLTADTVTDFVRRQAAKLRPSPCGQLATAIRSLIRFLASKDAVPAGLLGAVPAVRTWRHSSIPRTVSAEEVERVLAACNTDSAYGLRERAIVLLLARLGLRAGEVIRLRVEDIDWLRGCVLVRAGKTHRERSLPLFKNCSSGLGFQYIVPGHTPSDTVSPREWQSIGPLSKP